MRRGYGYGQGKSNQSGKRVTSKSLLKDGEILSDDGETLRTPKPLFSKEFEILAKRKAELIEEKRQEREKIYVRPAGATKEVNSNMDSHQVRDSSLDRSSDSHKMGTSSQLNGTSYARSSETDNSEENQGKRRERHKGVKKQKEDPNADIAIILEETETVCILDILSMMVTNEDEEKFEEIKKQNEAYQELVKIKNGSDNYGEHAAQTLTLQSKPKAVVTIINEDNDDVRAAQVQVNEFEVAKESKGEGKTEVEELQEKISANIDQEFDSKLKDPFCMLPLDIQSILAHGEIRKLKKDGHTKTNNRETDTSKVETTKLSSKKTEQRYTQAIATGKLSAGKTGSHDSKPNVGLSAHFTQKAEEFGKSLNADNLYLVVSQQEYKMIQSPEFKSNIKYMERILNETKYHKEYIDYRNYPEQALTNNKLKTTSKYYTGNQKQKEEEKENEKKGNKSLKLLFKYQCADLENKTVSSLDFNSANTDLLAATYGSHDLNSVSSDGCIAFWTLKNPEFPERIIKTNSRAMSCKFSKKNPNLIGVGCYDGVVSIYDIRKPGHSPIADSQELDSKHLDAVWEVDWVGKSNTSEKGEGLISISSDGKLMEWSIKKGLEAQELKWLNRNSNPFMKEESSDAINFRFTTGFSFDFIKNDTIFYFVATEDGIIHRCSKSYKDQYLRSYYGHTGPVYKVRCNPFWSNIFISCSADWTCRIWNWEEEEARYVLRNLDLTDEVYDVEWSPYCSTLFSSCAKDGRLELWDLKVKSLDPIHIDWDGEDVKKDIHYSPKTAVKFNPRDPILVSGDESGTICVHRIFGYEDYADQFAHQQEQRLVDLLYPAGYNKQHNDETD